MSNKYCDIYRHGEFLRTERIIKKSVPSGLVDDRLSAFVTESGARFYMKSELGTSKHYNVGNRAYWAVYCHE